MDRVKQLLNEEGKCKLSPEIMDMFLEKAKLIFLKKDQVIVDEGEVNKDIYIVKDGIIAYTYMDGSDERCYAFALPASIIFSTASYYMGEPSFYRIIACCPTEVLHISKRDYDDLIRNCPEFAQYVLSIAINQLYLIERKNILINGTTTEKFKHILKLRPEIVKNVTSKLIASYLGITQQHLCRLKRQLM